MVTDVQGRYLDVDAGAVNQPRLKHTEVLENGPLVGNTSLVQNLDEPRRADW